ncbi:MAG TPA: tetratricopeptide repeat protein [Candidatus Cloacimonadota bacterium]|nr:tetratricopeptide repeat protein [Candidatus Cloacimonadota bacterium]
MESFFELLRIKRMRQKGQKLLAKGKFEKAFPLFQKIVLQNESPENIYNLALCLMAMSEYETAESYLEKIQSDFSGNEMNLLALAECKMMQKKWQDAKNIFHHLAEANPRHESYQNYFSLVSDEVAREKYISAKKLLMSATACLEQKNDKEALKLLLEANELHPDNPNILNNLGSIYMLMEDYRNAYNYFSKAYNLDKNNPKIRNNILTSRRKLRK